MKKYFVQVRYPYGEVDVSVNTAQQIIEMVGFSDCTGCSFQVFDGSVFGTAVHLIEEPRLKPPYNLHRFLNPVTGEVAFEGYSKEH